jgi:chromosome segregation protein
MAMRAILKAEVSLQRYRPMLKALEIVGFKSFADRTRFEFPPGITVVVGPNGSGKSNIVDAIKWVLGEQSVKSLRGREMADVIFNGSGSRRAMNTAEITLTFDNSKHLLAIDTPEVHITRRVYRSGEGEYLINRSPARLRDIRDLLSGTGMGTQAYSVIEQGKVDVLLQSSARDRRVIFEEAAGISRFKVRKIEALRRLERVQQNLLRLSDIVEEVENRLRGVRTQAGKARRYKEHTGRLQELRTQVSLGDWKRLSERLGGFEGELQQLSEQRDAGAVEGERFEAQLLEIDGRVGEIHEQIRQGESHIAANRERIAAAESTIEHERSRGADLEQEISRYRRQLAAMSVRAGDVQQQLQDTTQSLNEAQENQRDVAKRLVEAERGLTEAMAALDQLRNENEQRRAACLQQMRLAAALGNETSALESQVTSAAAVGQRCGERIAELDRTLDELQRELEELRRGRSQLTQDVEERAQRLEATKSRLAESLRQYAARDKELSGLRQRHTGAAERAAVLDELVRRHEGVSEGVKEALQRAADPADRVFNSVCGLVADVFHASVEIAPLVEIALGQTAQHLAATQSDELLELLQAEAGRLGGRVGFVWLDGIGGRNHWAQSDVDSVDLEGQPGVLGRADRFVETEPRFASLAKRLLGRTWFVEKLPHAIALARLAGKGRNFVTLSGELLEADETLVIGPRNASSGLISRRSQLRALQTQLGELQTAIEATEGIVAGLKEQIAADEREADVRSTEYRKTADALAENRVAVTAAEERRSQFDRQRATLEAERQAAEDQHAAVLCRLTEAQQKRVQVDSELSEMEAKLAGLGEQISGLEGRRADAGRETTEIKVELAKCEEGLRNLHSRMRQFEENRQERHRAIDEARERLAECSRRDEDSRWKVLTAEAEVAELYLCKEGFAGRTIDLVNQRESLQEHRVEVAAEIQKIHARGRKIEEKMHTVDLSANEVRHERNGLADRIREDYGIELSELEHQPSDEEQHQREEVQQEIEELRQKINNLGNVNLEALDELEQLEGRFTTLSDQYRDLVDAKGSLEKIIDKINTDSRRLFAETLETVKGHFQTLFRDLFGGGSADILLEENVDILDSGIEIVARPPGKEPRSISLLSGGEKTLTCAALLLAIFRSRPSPFCVLDEVDAALDEANIHRFTQVLQDFLAWTQFIIVTHSKKTMTSANTIYGVTMQESGVSKQVSVRFEDVSDDGHILTTQPADKAA